VLAVAVSSGVATAAWISLLYDRIDHMQDQLDQAHAMAGEQSAAIEGLELDNRRLADALERQTLAVQTLAAEANAARRVADERAAVIAAMNAPPAGDGAAAMLAWWNDHVVR
jgi:hypothetical protein